MKKLCFLMPYFGPWPRWIDLFLETCRHNPDIDWIFFSDNQPPKNQMKNVHYIRMNLDGFNRLASEKLGFSVKLNQPYKLCDLRPAFGKIFADTIEGYDFFGYGDLDVIYGKIRDFVTEDILDHYDVITPRRGYLVGHFILLRNNTKISERYANIPGFQNLCRWPWPLTVDEHLFPAALHPLKIYSENLMECEHWPTIETRPSWKVYWREGNLINAITGKKLMYFHFLRSKNEVTFCVPQYEPGIKDFYLFGKTYRRRVHTPLGRLRWTFKKQVVRALGRVGSDPEWQGSSLKET